ncbi:TNF receptor-associated factor 3-like isoform X1 [Haemaphysalis longicornis]
MAVPDKHPIKDVGGLPQGVLLSFEKRLKPELICCTCDAVTPNGLKDGKGHLFCRDCAGVQTDSCNLFTCCLCGFQGNIDDMTSNEKEWHILEKMTAACPNEDKCPFKGTLGDVLRHYKTCGQQGKVLCPLCDSPQDRKTLADHMNDVCPRRFLKCCFCQEDVQACNKLKHESSCRQRPATCQHCEMEFQTVAELEDEHYEVCPQVPIHCTFQALGCEFYETRNEVTIHEANAKHTELLVQELCRLKQENKRLSEEKKRLEDRLKCVEKKVANGLTEDTMLQRRLQSIEDKQNEHDLVLLNVEGRTRDLGEEIKDLRDKAAAPRKEPELERRLAKLEETNGVFQKPLEQLFQSMAGLK